MLIKSQLNSLGEALRGPRKGLEASIIRVLSVRRGFDGKLILEHSFVSGVWPRRVSGQVPTIRCF